MPPRSNALPSNPTRTLSSLMEGFPECDPLRQRVQAVISAIGISLERDAPGSQREALIREFLDIINAYHSRLQ